MAARGGRGLRLGTQENKGGVGFSPCCEVVGAKEAGGGAASRETEAEAAGSRRRNGAQFGFMGRKKLRGAKSSCWRHVWRWEAR
jgi:hypothetical protein